VVERQSTAKPAVGIRRTLRFHREGTTMNMGLSFMKRHESCTIGAHNFFAVVHVGVGSEAEAAGFHAVGARQARARTHTHTQALAHKQVVQCALCFVSACKMHCTLSPTRPPVGLPTAPQHSNHLHPSLTVPALTAPAITLPALTLFTHTLHTHTHSSHSHTHVRVTLSWRLKTT
jgi:hypothetical protein